MKNIDRVMQTLNQMYPDAKPELEYNSDFEFFVAVMLSPQCTDRQVNVVTRKLFKVYNTPKQFAELSQAELEKWIYSTGFYHNKAKNLISASKMIMEDFNGELPKFSAELQKLAGVGPKVANVVSSFLYNENKMAVDTHIFRVTTRLGLVEAKTPEKVASEWEKRYPQYLNHDRHLQILLFGRYVCKAQKPDCENCKFVDMCKFYKKNSKGGKSSVCR